MIWGSIAFMTIFDILVIGCVGSSLYIFLNYRQRLKQATTCFGLTLAALGLLLIALFYLADLATMHVFPLFMTKIAAMAVMKDLHLNYNWIITLLGIGAIAIGFTMTSLKNIQVMETLTEKSLLLETTFENMSQGFIVYDRNNNLVAFNQQLIEVFV